MIILTLLFAALSLVSGQRNPGYDSSPLYVQTFDRAPTAVERQNSSFVYVDNFRTRRGAAFFNRGAGKDYIDLLRFPDNYGRMFPGTWWGEASFELWVFARDFVNWQRTFQFANSPNNTAGAITGNPLSDEVVAIWAPSGESRLRYQVYNGGSNVQHATNTRALSVGEWIHIVCTTTQILPGNNDANAAYNAVFLNGVLQVNSTGYLPKAVYRNLAWLGRSAAVNNGDPAFHGLIDNFAYYNYPLSREAIYAHMMVERPPVFELTFTKFPGAITGAATTTFGWAEADGQNNGVLLLSGTSQSVNLLTSTGTASAGTSMVATQGGASGGVPAVAGWSYSIIAKFNALVANAALFDFAGTGTNRVRMYVNGANNVVFSWNGVSVTSTSTVAVNTYYHIAATVSSTGALSLYINNGAPATATGATLAATTFTSAFLGQSTDATPVFMNGRIDAFRVYDQVLSAVEVSQLTSTIGATPDGQAPMSNVPLRSLVGVPAASGPVVSYTFDSPPTTAPMSQGFSNWTWMDQRYSNVDRSGMVFLDGNNNIVALTDTLDNSGNLHPTLWGGEVSFETRFQFLASMDQAMIFSLFGPKSMTSDNFHLMNTFWQANNNPNSLKFEVYGDQSSSAGLCLGCTNGSWAHAIVTVSQPNASDSTSSTSGLLTMFLNGQTVLSVPGYLPRLVPRTNAYLGLSGWGGDQKFYGYIDSYHMYNYPLTAEAAMIHSALPLPPAFELTFDRSPVISGSTFGWIRNETDVHIGILTLSGSQFVNLSATSGPNFVGFTAPLVMGTGRSTPGVPQSQDEGWSFHIVFKPVATTAGQTIVEFADAAGANALKLAYTADGLVFTGATGTIGCGTTGTEWLDVSITIGQDRNSFEGQCYVNGARIRSVPAFPSIPAVARNSVLLGKSNTGTGTNFAGQIDGFRVMAYALTSEDAYQLWTASSRADRTFIPPAYTSGPILAHTFDREPPPATDIPGGASFNFYNWQVDPPAYAAGLGRQGVVVFNGTGNSYALRQYIDLNFDQDAFGNTLPQITGGSMSFEMWINAGSPLRQNQTIFDIADNPTNNLNGGQGIGQFNILLASPFNGNPSNLDFASYHAVNTPTTISADILNAGTWQHIAVVVAANGATSTATIYVDGIARQSGTMPTPPSRMRRSAFIGRSQWDRAALFATMDSFYYYNYPLDVSQIRMHMMVPYPPTFDASFETNPLFNTLGSNYGWQDVDPTAPSHRGVLTFSGQAQFVDLAQGSGGLSIGQYFPVIGGVSLGSPADRGFTLELSVKWGSLATNCMVLDLSNGGMGGADMFGVGNELGVIKLYTQNGLTDERTSITLIPTAAANTWYHIVVTAVPVAGANDTMTFTPYINGVRGTSAVGWAPLPVIRRTAYLARSTATLTAPPTWFNGSVDLIRYYSYVQQPAVITQLYQMTTVVPSSSSSTGVARSSSSSSSSAVVVPSSSTGPVTPGTCRGAGYDFTSLMSQTLILDAGQYRWAIKPCGVIAQTGLCDGMFCQNTTTIARHDPNWQGTSWWQLPTGGVVQATENGVFCGNSARRAEINWMCNATATTPIFRSVTEPNTCRYVAVVETVLACNPTGSTGEDRDGVGDDFVSPICGGGVYDISSLTTTDIRADNRGNFNYTIRLCGQVSNPGCSAVQPASICQQGTANSNVFKLADHTAQPSLYSVNEDGMNITSFTGTPCGSVPRTSIVKLVCAPSATSPVVIYNSEPISCLYLFIINTNAVCGAPFRLPSSSSAAVVPTSSLRSSSSVTAVVTARSSSSSSSSSTAVSSASATSTPVSTGATTTPRSSSSTGPVSVTSSSTDAPTDSSSSGFGGEDSTGVSDDINGAVKSSFDLLVLAIAAILAVIIV